MKAKSLKSSTWRKHIWQQILPVVAAIGIAAPQAMAAAAHEGPAQDLETAPVKGIEMYLDGFHIFKKEINKDQQKQVRVAHFCRHVNPNLLECTVYNGNGPHARLIGIEYVITKELYDKLSDTEKQYWHPHDGEVETGMLRLPGMDAAKEKDVLNFVKTTYGKTWNLWQPGDELPVGDPELMWPVDPKKIGETTKASMKAREENPAY